YDSPPIDLIRLEFLAVFRTFYKSQRQKSCDDAKRNVDIEDIRPREIIHQITSKGWTKRRPDDDAHSVNRLRHSAFCHRITFGDDGLRGYQQRAAAKSLDEPKDDEFPDVVGISAQKRRNG